MPNFPVKTALAFATALAALAAYRLADPTKGLSPAIFPETAHITLFRQDPSRRPTQPLNGIQQPQPTSAQAPPNPCTLNGLSPGSGGQIAKKGTPHPPVSPYFIDVCGNLDPFFAALHHLEVPGTDGPQTLTILHYGDSPTTADLITGDVRELLQQRFGNAGTGFILPAKPWAWYQHRGVDLSDSGWTISTAVGKGREEVYGLGGASFEGSPGASTRLTLKEPTTSGASIEVAFLYRPNAGSVSVSTNGNILETFSTALDPSSSALATSRPNWHTVSLPPETRTIELKAVGAPIRLFGINLLSGHPGVLYDSLGLNGASTSVLSNGFNAQAWAAALQHTRPALVIINYGTNESGFGAYVDKQYEPTLRTAIARIRAALPGEPILVMSPMDRGRRSGVDQIETYDTIPRIVAIQRRVAAELNCAFFDTFNAMGGDGTMSRWYTGHPRLVAGDLIHPTPQGASMVAQLFVHDLSLAYDRYLGHPPTPQTSRPEPLPAAHLNPAETPPTHPLPTASKPKPSAAGEPIPQVTPPATPEANPEPPPIPPTPSPEAPHA